YNSFSPIGASRKPTRAINKKSIRRIARKTPMAITREGERNKILRVTLCSSAAVNTDHVLIELNKTLTHFTAVHIHVFVITPSMYCHSTSVNSSSKYKTKTSTIIKIIAATISTDIV